jgi:hypothetical protein
MADSDEDKLIKLGAEPVHEDETALRSLGAVSPEEHAQKAPPVSKMTSAAEGLASGGTFGFSPRIGAVFGAGLEKGAQAIGMGPQAGNIAAGQPTQSLSDLYNEYLAANNKRQAAAKAANPVTYGAAQLAGGIASPLNKIGAVGQLSAEAPIIAKMGQGALAGARMGTVAGLSQSQDLTNPSQDVSNMGLGAATGATIGATLPPIGAVIKGGAGLTADLTRKLVGRPVTMFNQGVQAGQQGAANLAGEPGQLEAVEQRGQFATQFVQDLHNILSSNAANKKELIANALENSQLAPKEAVEAVTQKYLQANPQINDKAAKAELAQLKEMITTAAEGPEKEETVRQYSGALAPQALPSAIPNAPPSTPQTATAPPIPQATAPTPTASSSTPPVVPATAAPSQTPVGFEGYEAVHKATVDPTDEDAVSDFHQKVQEKLADERALGQNDNDNPIEIHQEPIEGSDKVRMVARRPIVNENPNDYKAQADALSDQQKQAKKYQDLLDQQQEEAAKQQQAAEVEMAKPQFQDIQQTVREGGRNLQDPQELYNLYNVLKQKSKINPGTPGSSFGTQQMQQMSGQAAKDIAGLIKQTIPETQPIDSRLNAANNIASRLGIKKPIQQMGSPDEGTAAAGQANATGKVLGIINPEGATNKNLMDQDKIDFVTQQLNRIDPRMGQVFQEEMAKHSQNANTINELMNPGTIGGGGPELSAARRTLAGTAYNVGHKVGTELNRMQPSMQANQKIFTQYTPQALQDAAASAVQSTNKAVQQLGQVFSKLATSDDRTRNAMMFALEQNVGYREMMKPYFKQPIQSSGPARNKTLGTYK